MYSLKLRRANQTRTMYSVKRHFPLLSLLPRSCRLPVTPSTTRSLSAAALMLLQWITRLTGNHFVKCIFSRWRDCIDAARRCNPDDALHDNWKVPGTGTRRDSQLLRFRLATLCNIEPFTKKYNKTSTVYALAFIYSHILAVRSESNTL